MAAAIPVVGLLTAETLRTTVLNTKEAIRQYRASVFARSFLWPVLRWPGYVGAFFCVANATMELLLNSMVSSIFAVRSRVILGTSPFRMVWSLL